MEIEETFIPGLKIIHLDKFTDQRGIFLKVFNEGFFRENGLVTNFRESYFSVSHKYVIRGMHFQIPPEEHIKLVYINQGSVKDVILDIRRNSPGYGKYLSLEISGVNPKLIYIPVGCAHGFLAQEDNTIVTYIQTSCYTGEYDTGIRFDSFGMEWNVSEPIISDRDRSFLKLSDFNSPFIL
jgi:dTDP-4-dehydrorhamnose 3,5-epimerase